MKKRLVVVVAMPDALALDITGPSDVFFNAKRLLESESGSRLPETYQLVIVSPTDELSITTSSGLGIVCQASVFQITEKIDTLLIGGFSFDGQWNKYPRLVTWLQENFTKIRRICSVCVGAFALAEAGLLKNRAATTHWLYCQQLSSAYENIRVDPNPIFVKDGQVYTSAGASAGIDLALALVEEDFGRAISLRIAQLFVLYLRRPGFQAQFSDLLSQQLSAKKPIGTLQQWMTTHLGENLDVHSLARRVAMSPRNFARVFLAETGTTPAKYVERLRIETAKKLLEESSESLDQIAQYAGFGSTDTMRVAFTRTLNTTPYEYRHVFGVS